MFTKNSVLMALSQVNQSCTLHKARSFPSNGLLGMCRWMGLHFHNWADYNGVAFSGVYSRLTRMGLQFFGTLRLR